MKLYDWIEDNNVNYSFELIRKFQGAKLGYCILTENCGKLDKGDKIATIIHRNDDYATFYDWQSQQPDMSDDNSIRTYGYWVFPELGGKRAIFLDGLPRTYWIYPELVSDGPSDKSPRTSSERASAPNEGKKS